MSILIENKQKRIKIDIRRVRRFLKKILEFLDCKDKEISLLFVDNEEIQKLNKMYLNRDWPTNVMSFPLSNGEFSDVNPDILGDIVVSVEIAQKDAERVGIEFDDELDFLMIHGILHLLNYNHENTSDEIALLMKKKEQELFYMMKGYHIE